MIGTCMTDTLIVTLVPRPHPAFRCLLKVTESWVNVSAVFVMKATKKSVLVCLCHVRNI